KRGAPNLPSPSRGGVGVGPAGGALATPPYPPRQAGRRVRRATLPAKRGAPNLPSPSRGGVGVGPDAEFLERQSSARRFLHERTNPCLDVGVQLRQSEGVRPHGALVEVRRVAEAERRIPRLELLCGLEEAD